MNNYLGKKIDLRFFSYIKVIISNNMSSTNNNLRDKISAWLSDRTNDENDLVDFLVDECGCVVENEGCVAKGLNCVHCKQHIYRDTKDHDNCHINEKQEIICQDCLDECDCEDCLHICGETGGHRHGGCGKRFNYNDGIMIDNTSYCLSCGEKEEEDEQCNDCKIEAKKHCDVCGGYGGGSEDEE